MPRTPSQPRRRRLPSIPAVPATGLLLAVLLAVNAVAVWGIFSARRSAEDESVRDLGLTTAAQARALEADVAGLAGDVLFLAQSPSLLRAPEAMDSGDPMVARWARLGAEGNLLLFVESRDEVERVLLRDGGGEVLVAVGRRQGAPVVLPPEEAAGAPPGGSSLRTGRWSLGTSAPAPAPALGPAGPGDGPAALGSLELWVDPARLLLPAGAGGDLALEALPTPHRRGSDADPGGAGADSAADPGAADPGDADLGAGDPGAPDPDLARLPGDGGGYAVSRDDGRVRVSALVVAEAWRPPLAWELSRSVDAGSLVRDFDLLAGRYRTTLAVNLGVVTLTLALGVLAFREVRRSSRLAAENAQQARVRELERRMMHNERLAGVGRLASGLAHEINNPLEGMTNYLRLLEDDLERGDLAGARASAERVGEGLARAAGVTRQVLTYSDPGRAPKQVLDLRREVAAAVAFVRESGTCAALRDHPDPAAAVTEPLPVRGNATTLGQLFLNLLLNACQASDAAAGGDGDDPSRTVAPVEVHLERRGDRARVEVRDRGRGIPEDALPQLFEPFFSTRGSTGLGLAVCHGVVTDHGGEIHAANRPGGGAVLSVELPLAAGAEAPDDPVLDHATPTPTETAT